MLLDRKLIDYLPLFVQAYAEIKAIMNAEQVNVVKAWADAEDAMNDQFILDATENGVNRWESMLGITPKAIFTLDERKFQILAHLNKQLPYTLEALNYALTTLCGQDGYRLKLVPDKYELTVKLALKNENNMDAVRDLLENMVPANIICSIQMFNTQDILVDFTHGQLKNWTHDGLRKEVL